MLRQLADKMEKEADFMECVHDQSELLAMRCQRLQKLCESQQRKMWTGMGNGTPSSLTNARSQDHPVAANSAGIKEAPNGDVHPHVKWENARPAPLQVPDLDESPGSLQGPSPLSSMDTAVNVCSPQELDPHMMLCNPLYSLRLSRHGMAPGPTSESSFQEAASTSVLTSQPRAEVSLCSSPAGADLKQQQFQQRPSRTAQLSQLASQKSWPPELAPSRDAAATSNKEAAAVAPEKQVAAHGRHVAAPSEGESSRWFGAAAGRTAGSCVSSPRPAAALQTAQGTHTRQVLATAHAPMAQQLAQTSGHAEEKNWAAGPSISEYASSEAAASQVLDTASVVGPVPGQARSKRPWQPRPPPPPSSCASNRPQKSSEPFFPPAARFVPSPNSRMAATRNFADEENLQCGSDFDDAGSGQPQQKHNPMAIAEASTAWDAGEEVDVGAGEACSSKQQVQGMDSHTPGTMIVKDDLTAGSTEARLAWEAEYQRTHGVLEQGRLPRLQKENSTSPEQRPVQSGHAKLDRPSAAETRSAQQPVSPLRESNSPDAAARIDSPVVRSAAAGPAPGGRRLADPGPLAASSPALVRTANRLLRSLPADPASLHSAPRAFTHAGVIPNAEVSLASPLRRSMQHIQLHTTKELLHGSERRKAQPEGEVNKHGKRDEPDAVAMLRASGILQRDGPLAASGAAALKRASEPPRPVGLPRPHPADLEAAERLRASLSSEGSGASRASAAAPSSADAGGCRGRPRKPERASQEELPLRASGSTQAPRTPKHAPRPSTVPDSPLTSTSDVAHEHGSMGLTAGWRTPPRPVVAAGEKQPPPTVPKHLATPSLMMRAGDAAVYDEPEVDRVTPRGNPPPHPSACSFPKDEGLHPIKAIAAPEHPTPEASLADEDNSADAPDEADAAATRVKPQLLPHLRGAFSPGRAKSGSVPSAAGSDSLPAPEPQIDKAVIPPQETDASAALTIQDNKPDRLGVSAAGLAAAAALLKRVSAPPVPPPPPPPPAPKGQVPQQAAVPTKAQKSAPADARDAMLSAIKNGQFKLRKTPHQIKGEAAGASAGAGKAMEQQACTPAMAALMERARAMRAATYPESSVNGSSASSWGS
ncbi:hypothetical protein COCOBI_08-0960 [Coccomyxa sp. Obi]|nr:hypothetical protein COCOBI_08-0960 [Coccomyxa sp. Obi]